MPSYYNRVKGTLEVAKLAQSSDIHLIQSSIQNAISSVITDMFGPSFVLGEAENDLKLVPTAIHVDQKNEEYDEEDQWISFYERYFRQPIFINKSSIESIILYMTNDSNIETTVYAEIRDINYNLLKETNAKLKSSNESNDVQEINFVFNLNHLSVGRYYFILKPLDLSTADLTINGDENEYDVITPDMFTVRYDRNGNYQEGLEASYNGVDYLEAYLLEDQLEYDDTDTFLTHDNNFDLCFTQIFSSGNTYLINPGAAIVHGQKVYPIDTHVTIPGPSTLGNRTDLIILTKEGRLEVIKGNVSTGDIKRPCSDSGLKIAYITSYQAQNSEWTCPICNTINVGNTNYCTNCGETVNIKVPLIEQADDNGMTRQRDVLERLRRLEKMMTYEQEYNRPTRVKYMCTSDPIIYQDASDKNNEFLEVDDSYGVTTIIKNGEKQIVASGSTKSETYKWSIINEKRQIEKEIVNGTDAVLHTWDMYLPVTKPKGKLTRAYYHAAQITDKEGNPISGQEVSFNFKKGKSSIKTTTGVTNSLGFAYFDIYKQSVKTGTYTMVTTSCGKSITTTINMLKEYNAWVNVVTKNTSKNASKDTSIIQGTIDSSIGTNLINGKPIYSEVIDNSSVGGAIDNVTIDKYGIKKATVSSYTTKAIKSLGTVIGESLEFKNKTIKRHDVYITIIDKHTEPDWITNVVKDANTFTGYDSFSFENAIGEYDLEGTFKIDKINNKDDEYVMFPGTLISKEKESDVKPEMYKIYKNSKDGNCEYPVLNFTFDGGYVHSLTPYIKKFKNIESFQIILFENNKAFNQENNQRIVYQKRLEDDTSFPNIYVSPVVEIGNISKTDVQGNKILNNYYKFIVDKYIPKGNYSLFVYSKLAEGYDEGVTYINQYSMNNYGLKYGMATKVIGTANPSLIYLSPNNISSDTWDIQIEKRSDVYKSTGIIISKPMVVEGDFSIASAQISWEGIAPDGCDIRMQISNDGGRNWITVNESGNLIKFAGRGKIFEWKVVLRGNGTDSPVIKFNSEKGYAIKCVLNETSSNYVEYEDFGRCLCTPIMDFSAMTYKVFGDPTISQKDFSEWEWARLFMEDDAEYNEIQILISNGNTDSIANGGVDGRGPIYTTTNKDYWNRQLFFHQAICGLTINDFEQTSVDYSNYDPQLEYDEHNFRFKYDSEYGETIGPGEILGTYENAERFTNYPTIDMSHFESDNHGAIKRSYEGNKDDVKSVYSGMHPITMPYYGKKYIGNLEENNNENEYYNSDSDRTYDRQTVINGMLFENGLHIEDYYTNLTLNVYISMNTKKTRPYDEHHENVRMYNADGTVQIEKDSNGNIIYNNDGTPKYTTSIGANYFQGGIFELIISLNPYGLMDEDRTYGIIHTIKQNLYNNQYNQINFSIPNEFIGSDIYCIGIRVKDFSTDLINDTNTTLMNGDSIGLADLVFHGHDRLMYWPAESKYAWKKGGTLNDYGKTTQISFASIISDLNGIDRDVVFPLTSLDDYDYVDNQSKWDLRDIKGDSRSEITTDDLDAGTGKRQTTFVTRKLGIGSPIEYCIDKNKTEDENKKYQNCDARDIHINSEGYLTDGHGKEKYLDFPEIVFNFLYEPTQKEPLFYIDVDFILEPYTWVRIMHYLEAEVIKESEVQATRCPAKEDGTQSDYCTIAGEYGLDNYTYIKSEYYTKTMGQYHSGDIIFEFYDTNDHTSTQPVESFALPAWGRVQTRAQRENKEVHAWFKIRNGGRIKRIVVKRKNPTGSQEFYPLRLHLYDIAMHREKTVPALGSQLQMRIYPKSEANMQNTSIRKFGVVYRLS